MKSRFDARFCIRTAAIWAFTLTWTSVASPLAAQDAHFHNAPPASAQQSNPYAKQDAAVAAGAKLYATYCASCHGASGQGTGNIPPLSEGPTQTVPDGEVFWFITTGR